MTRLGTCAICRTKGPTVSSHLAVCGRCIRNHPDEALPIAEKAHERARRMMGLPGSPPASSGGRVCSRCPNRCRLQEGQTGYCGLLINSQGRITKVLGEGEGIVSYYKDPHPTNCVASWCCAGGTPAGYPIYSVSSGPEMGRANAAVFLGSCTYHCLFCQNHDPWTAMIASRSPRMLDRQLAGEILADPDYTCVCWFGGCPSSQMEFVLSVSRCIAEHRGDRILRICLETNGNIEPRYLAPISKLSLDSRGGLKFDLKFHSPHLQRALCGAGNEQALKNFRSLKAMNQDRREPPFLRASTLIIPGYVDAEEVKGLAELVAEVDPAIPYSLLAFHPCYLMSDLPRCTSRLMEECRRAALSAGLQRVRIGNPFLIA